jgi:hypothetical protein
MSPCDHVAFVFLGWFNGPMSGNPAYNALHHDVCVRHGWCGGVVDGRPSHVDDFIPEVGPVTAEQFVDWLFQAEGLDPSSDSEKWRKHKDALRDAFIQHLGADMVDASMLKWAVS